MGLKFTKVKTEHHILSEFHAFLAKIEEFEEIHRMIPGRISRQQKGSSQLRFRISYPTASGLKCTMSKGSTAQELFIICAGEDIPRLQEKLLQVFAVYLSA